MENCLLLQKFDESFGNLKRRKEILAHILVHKLVGLFDPLIIRLVKAMRWYINRMTCPLEFVDAIYTIVCDNNRMDTFIKSNGLQVFLSVLLLNPIKHTDQVIKSLGLIRHIINNNSFASKILYYNRATNIICKLCYRCIHPDILTLSTDIFITLLGDLTYYESTISTLPESHQFHGILSILQVVYLFLSGVHVELLLVGLDILKRLQVKNLLLPFDVPPLIAAVSVSDWGIEGRNTSTRQDGSSNEDLGNTHANSNYSNLKVDGNDPMQTPASKGLDAASGNCSNGFKSVVQIVREPAVPKTPLNNFASPRISTTTSLNQRPFKVENINKYLIPNFDDDNSSDYTKLLLPLELDEFGFTDFNAEPMVYSLTQWYETTVSSVTDIENYLEYVGGGGNSSGSGTGIGTGRRTARGRAGCKSFIDCIEVQVVRLILSTSMTESKILQLINRNLVRLGGAGLEKKVIETKLKYFRLFLRNLVQIKFELKEFLLLYSTCLVKSNISSTSTSSEVVEDDEDNDAANEFAGLDGHLERIQTANASSATIAAEMKSFSANESQHYQVTRNSSLVYKADILSSIISLFVMAFTTSNEKIFNIPKLYLYQSYLQDMGVTEKQMQQAVKSVSREQSVSNENSSQKSVHGSSSERAGGKGNNSRHKNDATEASSTKRDNSGTSNKNKSNLSAPNTNDSRSSSNSNLVYFGIDCDDSCISGDNFEQIDLNSEKIQFTVSFICDLLHQIFKMIFTNLRISDVSFCDPSFGSSLSIFNVSALAAWRSYKRLNSTPLASSSASVTSLSSQHSGDEEHFEEFKDDDVLLKASLQSQSSSIPKNTAKVSPLSAAIFDWFHHICGFIARDCEDMLESNLCRTHVNRVMSLTARSDVDIIFDIFRKSKVHYFLLMFLIIQINKCKTTLRRLKEAQEIKVLNVGKYDNTLSYFSCQDIFELIIYCKLMKNNVFEKPKSSTNVTAEADFAACQERLLSEVDTLDQVISLLLQLGSTNYDIHDDISNVLLESHAQATRSYSITHREHHDVKNSSSTDGEIFEYVTIEDGKYMDFIRSLRHLNLFSLIVAEEVKVTSRSSFSAKAPPKKVLLKKQNSVTMPRSKASSDSPLSTDKRGRSGSEAAEATVESETVKVLVDKLKALVGVRDLSSSVQDSLLSSMNISLSKVLVMNNSKNSNSIRNHSNYYFDIGSVERQEPTSTSRPTTDFDDDEDGDGNDIFGILVDTCTSTSPGSTNRNNTRAARRLEQKMQKLDLKVKEDIQAFLSEHNVEERFLLLVQNNKLAYNFGDIPPNTRSLVNIIPGDHLVNNSYHHHQQHQHHNNEAVHSMYLEYKALMNLITVMAHEPQSVAPNKGVVGHRSSSPLKSKPEHASGVLQKAVVEKEHRMQSIALKRERDKEYRDKLLSILRNAANKGSLNVISDEMHGGEEGERDVPVPLFSAAAFDDHLLSSTNIAPAAVGLRSPSSRSRGGAQLQAGFKGDLLIKDCLLNENARSKPQVLKGSGGYIMSFNRQSKPSDKSQPGKSSNSNTAKLLLSTNPTCYVTLPLVLAGTKAAAAEMIDKSSRDWYGTGVPAPSPKPLNLNRQPVSFQKESEIQRDVENNAENLDKMIIKHPLAIDLNAPNLEKYEDSKLRDPCSPHLMFAPTKPSAIKPSSNQLRNSKYI